MKKTLVIMAAGMGSRFGGLKQIEPMGPSDEIISDYNVYDAIRNGFSKVVFIIRKEHLNYFQENITSKFNDLIDVRFAFQEFDTLEKDIKVPSSRTKMLGTTHALLCAQEHITEAFAVINADDFYGNDSFKKAAEFIDGNNIENEHLTVNYPVEKVTDETHTFKRGVCFDNDGIVYKIRESEITYNGVDYDCKELEDGSEFKVDKTRGCAVNFFVFKTSIFDLLNNYYDEFLKVISDKNECLLPMCLTKHINQGDITLRAVNSESKWMGVTYKEEVNIVKGELIKLIIEGQYPYNLWENNQKTK